jgi:hypothetical protein
LVGLALDAEVHNVVSADGAVVDDDVPCPEGDGVPLKVGDTRLARFTAILKCGPFRFIVDGEPTFLTSKRFLASTAFASASPPLVPFAFVMAPVGASVISTSAIIKSGGWPRAGRTGSLRRMFEDCSLVFCVSQIDPIHRFVTELGDDNFVVGMSEKRCG